MAEEQFDPGVDILTAGQECKEIIFIVKGKVELIVFNEDKSEHVLETLKQGDIIGSYSVLFNEKVFFTARTTTFVKILVLPQEFFRKNKDIIEGLEEAIMYAENKVDNLGVPFCDFIIIRPKESSFTKLRRAVKKAKMLDRLLERAIKESEKTE